MLDAEAIIAPGLRVLTPSIFAKDFAEYLAPKQVAVGVPCSAERLAMGTRMVLEEEPRVGEAWRRQIVGRCRYLQQTGLEQDQVVMEREVHRRVAVQWCLQDRCLRQHLHRLEQDQVVMVME